MIISRKYGVTFHDHMDVKTLVKQWNKVDPKIRQANPTIEAKMISAGGVDVTQSTAVEAKVIAAEAFVVIQQATEAGAAILTSNVGYPAAQATLITEKTLETVQTDLLHSEAESLFDAVK